MLAIIASALLGLYVFLPDILFNRLAYSLVRLKKPQRTRFEEILSGIEVMFLPFVLTALLSGRCWLLGHWPFHLDQTVAQKFEDYKTVFSAAYSDKYFNAHFQLAWSAFSNVKAHQLRFLFWMYIFLMLQILIANAMTIWFGELSSYTLYRRTFGQFLLGRVSHWQVLLTGFLFPRSNQPTVHVDVMTSDDHLYSGTVADHFLDRDGELTGILLKDFRRFQHKHFEEDRAAGKAAASLDYWKTIPGANFYIPADKIANINIRYETPEPILLNQIQELLNNMNIGSGVSVSLEPATTDKPTGRDDAPPAQS